MKATPLLPIVIIGSGGFGREVRWLIESINAVQPTFDLQGFVETDSPGGGHVDGLPVWGSDFFLNRPARSVGVAVGIGDPAIKRKVVRTLPSWVTFPNLIHPSVLMSQRVALSEQGVVITAGNILTTSVTISSHVMLNLACTVGHDVQIGSYSVISPGVNISGCVTIAEGASIGTGAKIIQGRTIGDWSVIGAGSVVIKDVNPNSTVVGVPAQTIKTREPGWHDT